MRSPLRPSLLAALLLSPLLAGCGAPDAATVPTGTWRGTLAVPGGTLPFTFRLDEGADGALAATLVNGEEERAVDMVEQRGDSLWLIFPALDGRVDAVATVPGRLDGTFRLVRQGAQVYEIPFAATHGDAYRFFPAADAQPADIAGRWKVTFTGGDGQASPGVAEFRQNGAQVTGTFLTATGDHRYLEGEVRADSLYLSVYDGSHAYLYKATLREDGTLAGDFWSGVHYHSTWTAARDEAATLPDADRLTYLAEGYDTFDFTFPDLNGDPVSLSDPRFDGKVVVVTLAGSWCPNCHDEARFMTEVYDRYRGEGLEIVALMYEHYDDVETAAAQVQAFRDKFGIQYPTLVAGASDKTTAAETLPMLNHVLAFPTTIFVDRTGAVRRIHTGFSGPGTGAHYDALTADFTAFIETLLAEDA